MREIENCSLDANRLSSLVPRIDTSTFSPLFSSLVSAFERLSSANKANLPPLLLPSVVSCLSKGMKAFLSSNRASYNETETTFLSSILQFATVVFQGSSPHTSINAFVLDPGDDNALNETLGSLFAHVCGNACPLMKSATLSDSDKSFVVRFLEQLLRLCQLSVCPTRPDFLRPNLAGMTWKAYKVLISKFGGGLSSSLPCDAILKEWAGIFKSVYTVASKTSSLGPGNHLDNSLKYLRYCVVVVISVVQAIARNAPMAEGGGMVSLLYQITLVRSDLPPCPAPTTWPEGIEGKIASQLLSPLDSLFIHLLSSTPNSAKGQLLHSFISTQPTSSSLDLSALSPTAKLSLLLSLMTHSSQSFPFDTFQSCFDWVLESPSICFPSYINNSNPKGTPLFYKVALAVFTFMATLQESSNSGGGSVPVRKALVRLVSFAFHHHYLTREIAKESWSLLVTNGNEATKATTRQVIVSLVNNMGSVESRYSRRILSRLVASIAPLCFSETNPFPFGLPAKPTMPDLCKFLPKSTIVSSQYLSTTQRNNLCGSVCAWCVRWCTGFLKKDPACTLEGVEACLQLFSWILSRPMTFELVPVFSRQKISELVVELVCSPNRRIPSCVRWCLKIFEPLFPHWSPQEQLRCLQGLEATFSSHPAFAGPILRLLGHVCRHLRESPYLAKVYQTVIQILSKGLADQNCSIEAIAVFSTLELIACCCFETQYLLAAFGEHQQKIQSIISGEAPASSITLVREMAGTLSEKPSRKRKGGDLLSPSLAPRSFNSKGLGSEASSCEGEMEQFLESLGRLEGALSCAAPTIQQGVVSRLRAETHRICSKFESQWGETG